MNEVSETDLAWLAGIIDGEGNIGFEINSYGLNISARLTITNTDAVLIDEVLRIYKILGIEHYCRKRKKFGNDGCNRKPVCDLQVHRLGEVKRILELVIPYLHNKKVRAEKVVDFCSIRLYKRSLVGRNADARYGDEERQIVEDTKKLNMRGIVL